MPNRYPDSKSWCVAGLGNPGREYGGTRHNLGFSVLNHLAREDGITWRYKNKFSYGIGRTHPFFLVRPLTYMNLSGQAVKQAMRERNFEIDRLLVVCDDINLPLGQLRLRVMGSHGGQKGLKSIIDSLGTEDFARLRLGVGPLPSSGDASNFVLGRFTAQERPAAKEMTARAADSIIKIINQGLETAMNSINQKTI
jgi:PTH1 family peptidyl-tRNA hydrolase